ncbi:MAG: ferritin family protein [Syntrophorhabdus sp.]
MDSQERIDALEVALANETREREFYLKNAERTKDPVGKAMFERIAQDEVEHYERLKELHVQWKLQDKWPDTLPTTLNKTNIREILVDTLKKLDTPQTWDADDREAVRTAAEFEEKGVIFYKGLAAAASDEREKHFFELLSSIEYEHYLSLRDAEEYFENPAAWFVKTEHPMWDGG